MGIGGILVGLAIFAAIVYIVWKAVKTAKGGSPCDCCEKRDKNSGCHCENKPEK